MALLLLLTFDDEQEALDLAEQYENKGLVGIYKKPTMFCEFETRACNKRPQGFTRGLKYGWWVCQGCRKPRKLPWSNALSGRKEFGMPDAFNLILEYFTDEESPV